MLASAEFVIFVFLIFKGRNFAQLAEAHEIFIRDRGVEKTEFLQARESARIRRRPCPGG
jgi:hypothetical protein